MSVNFVRVADSLSLFPRLRLVPLAFLSIAVVVSYVYVSGYVMLCTVLDRIVFPFSLALPFLPSCPPIVSAGFLPDNIFSLYSTLISPELVSSEIFRSAVYTYTRFALY